MLQLLAIFPSYFLPILVLSLFSPQKSARVMSKTETEDGIHVVQSGRAYLQILFGRSRTPANEIRSFCKEVEVQMNTMTSLHR